MKRTFVLLLLLLFPGVVPAGKPSVRPLKSKLVLVVVVDQMRSDYLTRFGDLFGEGGFRLLLKRGAVFTNCAYDYAATFTGPGHSTILSGIPVSASGIIGNEWFDRGKQRTVYCVEDSSVLSAGISPEKAAGRMSPANFRGTTLGDQLLAGSPSSRVIGIAIKDRGAILLAGQRPTGAFWFDPESGNWITSTYYCRALPSWVERFNAARVAEGFLGERWTRLLPDSCYGRAGADDAPGEGTLPGEGKPLFPHAINDLAGPRSGRGPDAGPSRRFDVLLPTPYGDELTVRFSEAAIDGEQLGQRGVTDLLAVSFSSPDYCGHIFGPDSQEMEDILIRLDRKLEDLFAFIDGRIGLQNVTIVLTADHGVCPLPERQVSRGAARISPKDVLLDIKVRVGQDFNFNEGNDNLILSLSNGFIYLDLKRISERGFALKAFEEGVIRAALKEKGIVRCYTRDELEQLHQDAGSFDSTGVRIARSVNEERSGDIALLTSEYSFFSGGASGTTHGSPYEYDRHVPLLFFGPEINPGWYGTACRPNEIVPTLAEILHVSPPSGSDGMILDIVSEPRTASSQTLPPQRRSPSPVR
jgi:predicted AlkP superfamily pyrophosphatase or phosphodiesterase